MTGIGVGVAAILGTALGWWGAVAVVIVALAIGVARQQRAVWAACAVVVLAGLLGSWRAESISPLGMGTMPAGGDRVVVVTAPIATGRQQYFAVEAADDRSGDRDGPLRTCVSAGPVPAVQLGDRLRLRGETQAADDMPLARRASLAARGCAGAMYAVAIDVTGTASSPGRIIAEIRGRIGSALRLAAPGDAGVLLSGLVTGDDNGFSRERQDAFIRTGTTHLTAVSGSNLALVVGMLAAMGAATVGRHRWWWQTVTVGGAWAYAVISGSQPPAVRAAIVATAAVLAFRVGRRPDFATLILLAAGAMVVLEPRQVDALSFRLSVAASLALAVVLPGLVARDRLSPLVGVLAATTAAQFATLPLLLPIYGAISLASLPANIAVAPLAGIIMPLAALAGVCGAIWSPLGEVLAAPAAMAATVLLAIVDALGGPDAYVSVGVPPLGGALAIAVAAVALLAVMSGDTARALLRAGRSGRGLLGMTHAREQSRACQIPKLFGEGDPPPVLPAAAPGVFAREDPTHAFRADAEDPEEHPAREEVSH